MITLILGAAAVLVGTVVLVAQRNADRRRPRVIRADVFTGYASTWDAQDARAQSMLADRSDRGWTR